MQRCICGALPIIPRTRSMRATFFNATAAGKRRGSPRPPGAGLGSQPHSQPASELEGIPSPGGRQLPRTVARSGGLGYLLPGSSRPGGTTGSERTPVTHRFLRASRVRATSSPDHPNVVRRLPKGTYFARFSVRVGAAWNEMARRAIPLCYRGCRSGCWPRRSARLPARARCRSRPPRHRRRCARWPA